MSPSLHHLRALGLCLTLAVALLLPPAGASQGTPQSAPQGTDPVSLLLRGRTALDEYRLDEAERLLKQYFAAVKKARQPEDPQARVLLNRIPALRDALGHTEDVALSGRTDSLPDLLSAVRAMGLPRSQGAFILPEESDIQIISSVDEDASIWPAGLMFVTADGNTAFWSMATPADTIGVIHSASRLLDGTWEIRPEPGLPSGINPFLTSDGLTLYFASRPDDAIGGYDLMMTTRDDITSPWRSPARLGMPFNSLSDDILMAVDAAGNNGYWVRADFSGTPSMALISFIPSDMRRNLDPDSVDVAAFVRELPASVRRNPVREETDTAAPTADSLLPVPLPLPDGRLLTSFSQIRGGDALGAVRAWLRQRQKVADADADLARMYAEYGSGQRPASLAASILRAEADLATMRRTLLRLRNKAVETCMRQ